MIAIFGAALAVGLIVACIGPSYYCKKSNQQNDRSKSTESESPQVRITISHPQEEQPFIERVQDASRTRRSSIDSNECKEMKQVVQEEGPVFSEESCIVPPKTSCNRRRASSRIWSSTLRNQLENITNSSTEACGSTKVVQAQIERYPESSGTSSEFKSLPRNYCSPNRSSCSGSNSKDERSRKQPFSVSKKWKSLKRTFICSSGEQSLHSDLEIDDEQRVGVPFQTINQRSPSQHSATLQKNRLVDVSTSTRISTNTSNSKNGNEPSSNFKLQKNREPIVKINTEALQEVISLITRQSDDGKPICNVRINGLAINQSQFLNLFESTGSKTQTTSVVTTEEASIISIKLSRRRSGGDSFQSTDTSFYECPFRKLYRSLPEILEDLSLSKLFRSNMVSDKSERAASSSRDSDQSDTITNSKDETSFFGFSKIGKSSFRNEPRFGKTRT